MKLIIKPVVWGAKNFSTAGKRTSAKLNAKNNPHWQGIR